MWDLIVSVPDHCLSFLLCIRDSLTSTGGDSPCTGPPVNVPIQRTVHLFRVIPANDTKESMFGHQNVSSPGAGIKPHNLAAEASMCTNH